MVICSSRKRLIAVICSSRKRLIAVICSSRKRLIAVICSSRKRLIAVTAGTLRGQVVSVSTRLLEQTPTVGLHRDQLAEQSVVFVALLDR
jgi:hypothetical protein